MARSQLAADQVSHAIILRRYGHRAHVLDQHGYLRVPIKIPIDQNLARGSVVAQLSIIDERIKTEKENIDANRKIIAQLDEQVNQTLARSTTEAGAARSAGLRSRQAKERKAAQEEILSAQAKVAKLNEERAPIAAQVRGAEAEVGPIRYIAQLVYGQEATDQARSNQLSKTRRTFGSFL